MDSQEASSSAIAPSLMADLRSLDVAYNYFTNYSTVGNNMAFMERAAPLIRPRVVLQTLLLLYYDLNVLYMLY